MLEAYFDESFDESVLLVGGLVASESAWQALRSEWDAILSQRKLRVFGLADVLNGRGAFRTLPKDDRDDLIVCLSRAVERHVPAGVWIGLSFADLQTVLGRGERMPPGRQIQVAYDLASLGCVAAAEMIANRRPDPRVAVTFEAGQRGVGLLGDIEDQIRDPNVLLLAKANKRSEPALQAADLLVSALRRLSRPFSAPHLPTWNPHEQGVGPRSQVPLLDRLEGNWLSVERIEAMLGVMSSRTRSDQLRSRGSARKSRGAAPRRLS